MSAIASGWSLAPDWLLQINLLLALIDRNLTILLSACGEWVASVGGSLTSAQLRVVSSRRVDCIAGGTKTNQTRVVLAAPTWCGPLVAAMGEH